MCACCCLSEFFQTLINSFRFILWRLLCICTAQWSTKDCPQTPCVCKIHSSADGSVCGAGNMFKIQVYFLPGPLGCFLWICTASRSIGDAHTAWIVLSLPWTRAQTPGQHGSMEHPFINSLSLVSHFQDLLIKFLISRVIYCIPSGTATQRNRATGRQHLFSTDFDTFTVQLGMSFPSSSPKFHARAVQPLVFIASASLEVLLHQPSWC